MIDFDGKYNFSKIISIKNGSFNQLLLYPNPTSSKLIIENTHQDSFEIINSKGQTSQYQSVKIDENKKEIAIEGLPIGQYFVKVGNRYLKFLKK